jgi:hypothetical protein
MNGNKFATGQILKKTVEVVKGLFLAGWAQKSTEPCPGFHWLKDWEFNTTFTSIIDAYIYICVCPLLLSHGNLNEMKVAATVVASVKCSNSIQKAITYKALTWLWHQCLGDVLG